MATRSNIGIIRASGTVDAVYCHFDGYLGNNGRILLDSYTTAEQVEGLLQLGELRSLGRTPGTCWAYERNFGETGCANKRVAGGVSDGRVTLEHSQEYVYLFDPETNEWLYAYMGNGNDKPLESLRAAIDELV